MKDGKTWLKRIVLGSGVVVLTPIISNFGIPKIIDLGVITGGTALAAGIAAFVTQWAIEYFNIGK